MARLSFLVLLLQLGLVRAGIFNFFKKSKMAEELLDVGEPDPDLVLDVDEPDPDPVLDVYTDDAMAVDEPDPDPVLDVYTDDEPVDEPDPDPVLETDRGSKTAARGPMLDNGEPDTDDNVDPTDPGSPRLGAGKSGNFQMRSEFLKDLYWDYKVNDGNRIVLLPRSQNPFDHSDLRGEPDHSQIFHYDDSKQQIINLFAHKCVTVDVHSTSPAALLLSCMDDQDIYKWEMDEKGRIVSQAGDRSQCLTVQNDKPYHLFLAHCFEDREKQRFAMVEPERENQDVFVQRGPVHYNADNDVWESEVSITIGEQGQGSAFGDPHIETWSGDQYDFHGGCDLVLLDNPDFVAQNGQLGMSIHIRTKIKTWWSYIDSAVLRIGDDTLEIKGGQKDNQYWVNRKSGPVLHQGDTLKTTLAGHKIHFRWMSSGQRRFRVDLLDGDAVLFKTFQQFLRVNVDVKNAHKFQGSLGLMGSFPKGQKIARDHKTIMTDNNRFGKQWQVRPAEEGMLFHQREGPQYPRQCRMPNSLAGSIRRRRRLEEGAVTEEEAQKACERVEEKTRESCVQDVVATNNKDIAKSY